MKTFRSVYDDPSGYDSLIAATAILAGATLATAHTADFAPFVPHGLQLLEWGVL